MDFDLHVMVDWSASSSPTRGRDSIWTAVRSTRSEPGSDHELVNHSTRSAALDHLDDLVRGAAGRRVLIGVDFSIGYPAGVAARLAPDRPTWCGVWSLLTELVVDHPDNRNNRFAVGAELNRRLGGAEGPFWGHPNGHSIDGLRATRPTERWSGDSSFAELREVEAVLRSAGRRPFSVWQLCYAGSVGGQSLTGIPVLERLRRRHPRRVRVWPFETGLNGDPAPRCDDDVVIAEIWPSASDVDLTLHPVRDAAQVLHVTAATVRADRRDELRAWFAPTVGDPDSVVREEGWILGMRGDGTVMGA